MLLKLIYFHTHTLRLIQAYFGLLFLSKHAFKYRFRWDRYLYIGQRLNKCKETYISYFFMEINQIIYYYTRSSHVSYHTSKYWIYHSNKNIIPFVF